MAESVKQRILGIDPGSRATGFGVIDKSGDRLQFVTCGIIRASKGVTFFERIKEIHDGVAQVISQYQPDVAAIEDVFVSVNPRSALKLGHARGGIVIAVMDQDLEVLEFTPRAVKQAVAGYGNAAKSQVQHMVKMLLGLTSSPSKDAADALAVAICAANHLPSFLMNIS